MPNYVFMPGSGLLPSLFNTAAGLLQLNETQVISTCPVLRSLAGPSFDCNVYIRCAFRGEKLNNSNFSRLPSDGRFSPLVLL